MNKILTSSKTIQAAIEKMEQHEIDAFMSEQDDLARDEGGLWMHRESGKVDTYNNWSCQDIDLDDIESVTYNTYHEMWEIEEA